MINSYKLRFSDLELGKIYEKPGVDFIYKITSNTFFYSYRYKINWKVEQYTDGPYREVIEDYMFYQNIDKYVEILINKNTSSNVEYELESIVAIAESIVREIYKK